MASRAEWIAGARPRTLPASLAPVIVGTGAAAGLDGCSPVRVGLAAVVALALQIGVNFANDYSDGIRGTDLNRVGPLRLTASGAARPTQVKAAAWGAFGLAGLAGVALVALSSHWWLLAVGVAAVAAAWGYTGGRRPYGYLGLGEVFVFLFFGPIATLGTMYTQVGRLSIPAGLGAVGVGLIACALLMANNIRDLATDQLAGKRTLAVRLGERRARRAFAALIGLPLVLGVVAVFWAPWAPLVALLTAPAVLLSLPVLAGARGLLLVPTLGSVGYYELAYALLLALALTLA